MWLKNAAKFAGGSLLAVALIAWLLSDTDLNAVWEQMQNASAPMVLLAAFLLLSQTAFRVWRWGVLLSPVKKGVPFRPMFYAVILGYATSWVIPGRVGEFVRPALLSGQSDLPLGPCLGSVLADRLLDGFGVLVLFAVGLAWTPLSGEAAAYTGPIRNGAVVLVVLMSVPFALLIAASSARESIEAWAARRGWFLSWVGRMVLALSTGLDALKRPRLLLLCLLHTFGVWLTIALGTWVGVLACGAEVSFGAMLVIMPLLVLGIAVPTPGGAGGYHAALTFGLRDLFGVAEPVAVGASLIVHALCVVPMILLAMLLMVLLRLPFQDLVRAVGQVRAMGAGPRKETAS